jgi:hypothetical protein
VVVYEKRTSECCTPSATLMYCTSPCCLLYRAAGLTLSGESSFQQYPIHIAPVSRLPLIMPDSSIYSSGPLTK